MKTILFTSAFTLIFSYQTVIAQQSKTGGAKKTEPVVFNHSHVLSTMPAKALSNYLMMGYETKISDKIAIKIGAGYSTFDEDNLSLDQYTRYNYSGARFDLTYKYFIGDRPTVFNGWYFAPVFSYKLCSFISDDKPGYYDYYGGQYITSTPGHHSARSFNAGATLGYQVPISNNFMLDFYIGTSIMRSSGDYKIANRLLDPYKNNIGLMSGFSFGFGF